MPRPKRTKVASSAPAIEKSSKIKARNAADSISNRNTGNGKSKASAEDRNALEELENNNDKGPRRSRRSVFSKQEMEMSGAVSSAENQDERTEHISQADGGDNAHDEQARIGDSQADNGTMETSPRGPVAAQTPARQRGRPARTKLVQNTEHEKVLEALRARRDAAIRAQNEEIQVPSTPPEEALLGAATPKSTARANSSVLTSGGRGRRALGTPSAESSVLALANFKRRPRQPSILRMVQQGRDEQFGNDDDEDDFNPDDESTPLNLNKSRVQLPAETSRSSSSPGPSQELPSSSSRKRKMTTPPQPQSPVQVQVPRSSPPREDSPLSAPPPSEPSDRESLSPPPSLPSEHEDEDENEEEDVQAHSQTPEIWSQTMAPPASSFLAGSPETTPRQQRSTRSSQRQTARRDNGKSTTPADLSSDNDQSDQHEEDETPTRTTTHQSRSRPQRAAATTKSMPAKSTRSSKSKRDTDPFAISTATLQNLLPRRRRRRRPGHGPGRYDDEGDEFDIPSSDDEHHSHSADIPEDESDDDHDELSRPPRKPNLKTKPTNLSKPVSAAESAAANASKSSNAKTYGARGRSVSRRLRGISSDKENDDGQGPEDKGSKSKSKSRELEMARAKFQEVDTWSLEYEMVTASSSPPSSGMAR